jgi:LmbE family N-acetylglucosaminyl deacetylase
MLEYWEDGIAEVNYDHQDHKTTGRLVSHALADYAAASPSRCIRSVQWIGYATQNRPVNYTTAEASLQSAVWSDYNVAQVNAGGPNTNDAGHAVWLHRIYTSANGAGGVSNFGPCG